MSDIARSTIDAARSGGEAAVTLTEIQLAVGWQLRGDPAQSAFVFEAERLLGVSLPLQPNTSARGPGIALLWNGPRSWLWVADPELVRNDFDLTRKALNAAGGALFDVSASYAAWAISGAAAARVLNRGCPLDLHPRAFPAGRCAQSLLGHINALFYKPDEEPTFVVMVARSLAADAWSDLCASAESDGYRVAPPATLPKTFTTLCSRSLPGPNRFPS